MASFRESTQPGKTIILKTADGTAWWW
jgi:hypothetical protein